MGSYRVKGGGGSGGGGFSGDHLPVSGACSCRARFSLLYFFLSPHVICWRLCVYYSQVCKYVAAKESIGRRLSNGGSC